MKTCTIEGCENRHITRSYCWKHYRRLLRTGNPFSIKTYPQYCSVPGCREKHAAKSYCDKHYQKFKEYGVPLAGTENELHGMAHASEYRVWANMKNRCFNKNHKAYKYYGERGITVCSRWRNSFKSFFADMGLKPFPKAQIDRINNDGNYEPGNCRWNTASINCRNRSKR